MTTSEPPLYHHAKQALDALTDFGTVFRYDALPLEDAVDHQSWPPLIPALTAFVDGILTAEGPAQPETGA